jgi:hypothetical protein
MTNAARMHTRKIRHPPNALNPIGSFPFSLKKKNKPTIIRITNGIHAQ